MSSIIHGEIPIEIKRYNNGMRASSRESFAPRGSNRSGLNSVGLNNKLNDYMNLKPEESKLKTLESPKIDTNQRGARVHSSLEISNRSENNTGKALNIMSDYTPSQMLYKLPKRSGLTSMNQNKFESGLGQNRNNTGLMPIKSRLNHSIEGSHIRKIMANEYDNIISSKRYGLAPDKALTRSQKDLINRSHELNLSNTRNMMNPITGDFIST